MIRPLHIIVYSDPSGGKTTFLATLPKPMLVFSWDPLGKETPYLRCGTVEAMAEVKGVLMQRVMSRKDPSKLQVQVEHYIDDGTGKAYQTYLSRMARFDKNREQDQWASMVCDSVTFMELAARKNAQYQLNPTAKDPRQWYASGTETLEEQLMLRFGSLRCNVGVACHIDDSRSDIHGNSIRVPNAPGRLRKHLASAYTEFYHLCVQRDDEGNVARWLQVQPDDEWAAGTMIQGMPQFVEPTYQVLKKYMKAEGGD